ncbi:MAG: tetratricopeptide repeat protein [Acidobacteriota bacterium]
MINKTFLHYKIVKKLAEGGMGVVYLAWDTRLERKVAIKFLPSNIASTSDECERLKIEAKAAAALNHPNIGTIHAIEETENEMFIVMEYVEGQTLKEMVAGGRLQRTSIIDYAIQTCEGIKAAHDKSIIHRDIKSSNIMITETGHIKIMDFGLAKIGRGIQLTKEHSALGTAAYMSPEQTNGEDVDHRTDIWSFGVVLYEMLTGEIPFKGDYEQAVIYSILNEEPISVTAVYEEIPSQLGKLIERTLKKNPEDRYHSAKDLLEDLKLIEKSDISAKQQKPVTTIAVLPFSNMSTDKEQEYFCEGIAEDILNDLTNIGNLHVVARTSSFSIKDMNLDINEIGMKLGANTIVEGSVRKAGKRLRITAQLINVADGFQLWSERYDRELEDVFAIQDEISSNIVQALEIRLSSKEKRDIEKVKTKDVQAYDFYLRGRAYDHQGHSDSQNYAIEMYLNAIEKDKNFALAYAGLADSYSQIYMYYDKNKEHLEKALNVSQKALELDPELPEAYSSRALALYQNGQYEEAVKEFERAIQLNPKFFEAYYQYARICRSHGNKEQALGLFEKAASIRPEDYEAALFLVSAYNDLKMNTKMEKANLRALDVVRKHLDLNPDDSRALYLGAGALIKAGENREAIQWVKRAITLDPDEVAVLYNAACIYSELGKVEKGLEYFERAIGTGFASKEWIDNDTDLDSIRDHPRFQKALKKLNSN